MAAPFLLLASLLAANDEPRKFPAAPHEQCVEIRQFRANGGCRVAVDRSLAWMCIAETGKSGDPKYQVSFKSEEGTVVRRFSYDRRQDEGWGNHVEVFYMAGDSKANPDLKIGIAVGNDSQIVVGKNRYCLPADAAKTLKR